MSWILVSYTQCCTAPQISKYKAHDPGPFRWSICWYVRGGLYDMMQFSVVISHCNICNVTFLVFRLSQRNVAHDILFWHMVQCIPYEAGHVEFRHRSPGIRILLKWAHFYFIFEFIILLQIPKLTPEMKRTYMLSYKDWPYDAIYGYFNAISKNGHRNHFRFWFDVMFRLCVRNFLL